MEKIKLLHTADLHIGAAESFLGSNADFRRFETLMTFERIIDLATENGVHILAISGDLFDSNTIEPRFVDAVFEKIAAAPFKVFFSAGNHDPLNQDSPFLNRDLPNNLFVFGGEDECFTFDDIKLRVYGRSFTSASLSGEKAFSITVPDDDYINILVQHGELKSDLNSEYNAITPYFVKNSKMDYIALGHIHKRSDIGKIDGTHFAYCGCPEGQGFDELDEKGVYMGEIGKKSCSLSFVSVSKRRHIHHKTDITKLQNGVGIADFILSELQNQYGEGFKDNLYKIELIGAIAPDTELYLAELQSRLASELYFVKIKDRTEISVNLKELSEELSLKGIFVKKMLKKIEECPETEKSLYNSALQLGLKAFSGEVKYNED